MNSQDDRGWPEVDRRGGERRERPPPMHVSVDGLSNGAKRAVEHLVEELKEARKGSRRWGIATILAVAGIVFAAGEFRSETRGALEQRPTRTTMRAMLDSIGVLQNARDSAVVERLHEQQIILEILGERQRVSIEGLSDTQADVDRIKERIGMP